MLLIWYHGPLLAGKQRSRLYHMCSVSRKACPSINHIYPGYEYVRSPVCRNEKKKKKIEPDDLERPCF